MHRARTGIELDGEGLASVRCRHERTTPPSLDAGLWLCPMAAILGDRGAGGMTPRLPW